MLAMEILQLANVVPFDIELECDLQHGISPELVRGITAEITTTSAIAIEHPSMAARPQTPSLKPSQRQSQSRRSGSWMSGLRVVADLDTRPTGQQRLQLLSRFDDR